jgi:Mrp family chromosome partitioning ATPase
MADAEGDPVWPIVETEIPGVHLLPWGRVRKGFSHLKEQLTRLLAEGKKRYSLILLACSGGSRAPYAAVFGSLADGMILGVRLGHTSLTQVTATLRRWEGSGIQLFGFVLGAESPGSRKSRSQEPQVGVTA